MSTNLPTGPDGPSEVPEAIAPVRTPIPDPQAFEDAAGGGGGNNLKRYLHAILRYRWLVVASAVVGLGAGFGASRFLKPEYAAQATIWIEVTQRNEAQQGPIRSGQLLQSYAWLDLLRSFTVLDHVVVEQRLYVRPKSGEDGAVFAGFNLREQFRPGSYRLTVGEDGRKVVLETEDGVRIQEAAPDDSLGQALGFAWVPPASVFRPGAKIAFAVENPRDVARRLSEDLTADMMRDGNFLTLELHGTDPEEITGTLNAVADRYVEVAAELKGVKLNELVAILDSQLVYAESNLRNAEIELESFRVETITLPTERAAPIAAGLTETRDPVFDNYFAMKVQQEQLRRDRDAIDNALAQGRDSVLPVAALEYIESVQGSAELTRALDELTSKRIELRTLRSQYTDEFPTVRRLVDEIGELESRTIPRLADALIAQIDQRDRQIESLIRSASSELERIPPRQLEEARLERRVAIADRLYTNLRERYESARLAAASNVEDVRVLDRAAVPRAPVSDNRPQVMLMAFMGCFGLGLLGAILLDRFDPRLRYPEQVTQGLRLGIIGAVPFIKSRNGRLHAENTAQVIEAFRELRLSVAHAYGAAGPLVVTVTSPGAGDGKSFVSANLALSFADQGHRTLLIDGDVRRGGQHRLFGVRRRPGLIDYLNGTASLEETVQETSYPNLHLVGCGTHMQGAPEMLGSPAMAELMRSLRSRYGVIVVDSPPLGAGVDPFILGTLTGHLLLVLRTGYTDRVFAEAKLDLLDRLPVRILGAVLNAVPPQGVYRYYSYLPGYESREEEGVEMVAKQLPGV